MKFNHLKSVAIVFGFIAVAACGAQPQTTSEAESTNPPAQVRVDKVGIIDHTVTSLSGETVELASFRGRPMLIVNTASECGYTPQYEGLQTLHERYGERGLVVIGFPSNDFGNQEPGGSEEIAGFCRLNYGVSFPMMAKVHTKGAFQAQIYRTLTTDTSEEFRGEIPWNFTKFLVDSDGNVVARFESKVEPLDDQITSAVEGLLQES